MEIRQCGICWGEYVLDGCQCQCDCGCNDERPDEPEPVDIETLKQQIREIIDEHGKYCYKAGANSDKPYEGRMALSLADKTRRVLALLDPKGEQDV